MSEELKPCPHCGLGGDEIELLEDRERVIVSHYVYCDGCGARTGYKFSGEAAIAAWNRRAPSPDMREAVEARPGGSTTAFTRDQLARLAFVVFYSPVLCASQNIKAVADEIDCCPGCDHVSSGGTCHVSYRGDYCPNDIAETLRQIGVALYGPGNPSHYVESVFGPDQMPVFRSLTGAKP
jgi:Lar family restriction alleviation protein